MTRIIYETYGKYGRGGVPPLRQVISYSDNLTDEEIAFERSKVGKGYILEDRYFLTEDFKGNIIKVSLGFPLDKINICTFGMSGGYIYDNKWLKPYMQNDINIIKYYQTFPSVWVIEEESDK